MLSQPALVLHSLRIKGVASVERLVGATGLALPEVQRAMDELAVAGVVERPKGAPAAWGQWGLTSLGVTRDDKTLVDELDATGARPEVEALYRSFLVLNPELLTACTAWQLVVADDGSRSPNEHVDAAYDAAVVADLADIHRRVQPILDNLITLLSRMQPYRARLRTALHRVQGGDGDWFSGALLDSFHQVWFELHQDLLFTLGIERGTEGAPGGE